MARRMLVDASHPEETRVVIVSGNRLEEFDYETASKHQIKGNIYLAKVTRVEPSLQAAFVDYGGNRHGFLAFNEIHPDYYRIPIADRERLYGAEAPPDAVTDLDDAVVEQTREEPAEAEAMAEVEARDERPGNGAAEPTEARPGVEIMGGDEDDEIERERRRMRMLRNYRIQEVVKRRQIMLVQVTKEERGNKGAALTTYLSLAGRYCVLMPNTARGGGVSRKIANPADRKRLRVILDDLEIPAGMAVIVRTAGSERSRAEIKRDYEYLMRLWDKIRQLTLESISPALIHEEGNLIKRSIRDLYSRDIDEVLVDGEDSYRSAKDFMRMLMPSHASRVKRYKDETVPLFQKYRVETQLDEIHSNTIRLKSGGYLVLNPTEALVAIDVNSGRATRERHIEETALNTNLEAAAEVGRQLRLRDLAGLIVIDFIDMEENRNNVAVERKLKEALRGDRARIQLGRISAFGLLEMSRQRLRPSIIEASSQVCPHCNGAGHIRSTESSALQVLRAIEEEGLSRRSLSFEVYVPTGIALYMLNQKRAAITTSEARYGMSVSIMTDDTLIAPAHRLQRLVERSTDEISALRGADAAAQRSRDVDAGDAEEAEMERADAEAAQADAEAIRADAEAEDSDEQRGDADDGKARGRKRRGRRRKPRRDEAPAPVGATARPDERGSEAAEDVAADEAAETQDGEPVAAMSDARRDEDGQAAAKPRRGRRGGRRRKRRDDAPVGDEAATSAPAGEEVAPEFEDSPGAQASAGDGDGERAATRRDGPETGAESEPLPDEDARRESRAEGDEKAADAAAEAGDETPAAPRRPRRRTRTGQNGRARPARRRDTAPSAEDGTAATGVADAEAGPVDGEASVDGGSSAVDSAEAPAARPRKPVARPQKGDGVPADRPEQDDAPDEASEPVPAQPRQRSEQPRRGWWQRLIEG